MPRKIFSPLLLVTRPEPSASETAAQLRAQGYAVLVSPALHATPLPAYDLSLMDAEQLIVTSPQAARFLKAWTQLHNIPVWAVGARTAELLQIAGFTKVQYNASSDGPTLALELAQTRIKAFRILGAASTGQYLQRLLQLQGKQAERANVYSLASADQMLPKAAQALKERLVTHVLFYSARTTRNFMRLAADYDLRNVTALCLSAVVAVVIKSNNFAEVKIAERPTSEALQALLPALD